MIAVGAFEAESSFRSLLDRVEHGETVTITRDGKVFAQMVPTEVRQFRRRADVTQDLLEFGKGRRLQDMGITEMIEEGRRF